MTIPAGGAVNSAVRSAVAAFAADPNQQTSMDVLRHCLHGELLLDVTGSDVVMVDGEAIGAESLEIRGAQAPDGGQALLAFTSAEEIERMHPPGTATQAFGQPATAVVEFAYAQDNGWLFLDPGGTTCAMPRASLELAAQVPRNDAVREALDRPDALVGALRADGVLLLAADPAEGVRHAEGDLSSGIRTGALPGGEGLLAFTSAPELLVHAPGDAIVIRTTTEVLAMLRDGGYAGLVVNPAGPTALVGREVLVG